MAAAEEQANELEALESIYGAYFSREGPAAFALLLEPELDAGPKVNHVAVRLHASFPAAYPDAPPAARLSVERGLQIEQVEALRKELAAAVEEHAGAPCMYAVAERLREWLQAHNEPPGSGSGYEEMVKRQRAKESGGGAGAGKGARGRRLWCGFGLAREALRLACRGSSHSHSHGGASTPSHLAGTTAIDRHRARV